MSRYKKLGLAVLMIGVVAGSVVANMTYKANYYFLADLNMDISVLQKTGQINIMHFACYIIGKRLFQMILLAVVLRLFVLEAVIGLLGFTGSFTYSVFFTYQLLQSGMSGVRILILAMLPQWIFYGAALYYWVKGEIFKGSKQAFRYYFFVGLFFLIGIIMEIYVNPKILLM